MARNMLVWYAAGIAAVGGVAIYLYFSRAQAQPQPENGTAVSTAEQQALLQIYGEATSRAQNPTSLTFDDLRTHMLSKRRADLHRLGELYRLYGRDSEIFRGAVADFVHGEMDELGLIRRNTNDYDRIPWSDIIPELYTSRNRFPSGRSFFSGLVNQRHDVYEGAGNLIAGAR